MVIAIDIFLSFGAGITDLFSAEEDNRSTGVDKSGLQSTDARYLQIINQIAGREQGALPSCRLPEFQRHLSGRKGHPIQCKITALLYFTIDDGNMYDDGLFDIGLPDTYHGNAVLRYTFRVHQPFMNSKRSGSRGKIAAVSAPVDDRFINSYLTE